MTLKTLMEAEVKIFTIAFLIWVFFTLLGLSILFTIGLTMAMLHILEVPFNSNGFNPYINSFGTIFWIYFIGIWIIHILLGSILRLLEYKKKFYFLFGKV